MFAFEVVKPKVFALKIVFAVEVVGPKVFLLEIFVLELLVSEML